jgi:hypothetical protein
MGRGSAGSSVVWSVRWASASPAITLENSEIVWPIW